MTTAPTRRNDEFEQLERILERLNRRNSPGRIFREQIRRDGRLRRLSRRSLFGRAAVNTASILGSSSVDHFFGNGISSFDFSGGFVAERRRPERRTPPMIDGPSGGNTATGLSDIFSNGSVQFGLANVLANLFEGIASDVFNKTRTRTTVSESARSADAAGRWNVSRSQQDAELARVVNRGLTQL